MFGLKKSPVKIAKHNSVDPGYPVHSGSNPFNDDLDSKKKHNFSRRVSSEPDLVTPNFGTNPFDDDEGKTTSSSSSYMHTSAARNKYKNDFRDSGGLENQSVQELENLAVYKAEETTKSVNSCLKIAEDIREDATKTLVVLHQQGEQITKTHMVAADIDHDLSRGEKLLGSLGGMFSKTWKPKKTRPIQGPVITGELAQVEREEMEFGWLFSSVVCFALVVQIRVEKMKQDDALNDISSLLGELKEMAIDMGSEIGSQNKALDHLHDDVEVLDIRVKEGNRRARHLLHK
nr:Soluble N-ethylmaleimide-sensitive factor adaptor protein [Betula platyphylla]UVJ47682.1 soluble N-ethylmaleimide-sensitive factor adaptor protein [Betula platyphylla]